MITPILMLGAGRMGGAILDGWARSQAFAAAELMIVDPQPSEAALAAERAGARLNPPDADLAAARTVLLCVKPQLWLDAAAQYAAWLAADSVIVSIAAGVTSADRSRGFGGGVVARAMRSTAAAVGQRTRGRYAPHPAAAARPPPRVEPLAVL